MLSGPKSAPNIYSFWVPAFQCMRAGFSVPQMLQISLVYIPAQIKMSFIWKDDFLSKSAFYASQSQAHLAKQKRIVWSIDFNSWGNCTLHGIIPRYLCQIPLNYVSEIFICWERRWIDVDGASRILSVTAAIFSGVRTDFGFSRFGLSMSVPVSFTFFTR